MKKIIIACDSYKGCLSSREVNEAIASGLKEWNADAADQWLSIGRYRLNVTCQILQLDGKDAELSHRESEILRMLVESKNQVVESKDILLQLWGDDSFFNSRSLHVFITKLRHKLSADENIRIINVRGIGYKMIC